MTDFVCIGVPYRLGQQDPPGHAVDMLRESGIADELNAPLGRYFPRF